MSEWKIIPGFDSYRVSSEGEIYSLHGRGRILKQRVGNHGYRVVDLRQNKKHYTVLIHRVVALTFIGPCNEGQEVRHIDGNKMNNTLDNITYGTSSENKLDTVRHGTHHEARKTHCPNNHPYDEQNTYMHNGARHCRTCMKNRKGALTNVR